MEEIKIYTVFRFMDWGKTNNAVKAHTGGTRWEDRVKKSDPVQRPMAYEWMIDLCNRTGRDMWICLPHFADEEYMFRLASLIRDQFDPSLVCYVEWSNETWNGIFRQAHYTHNGSHSSRNSWGAKRYIGEPLGEAHKYRALRDYVIRAGQYDPKTGEVRGLSQETEGRK